MRVKVLLSAGKANLKSIDPSSGTLSPTFSILWAVLSLKSEDACKKLQVMFSCLQMSSIIFLSSFSAISSSFGSSDQEMNSAFLPILFIRISMTPESRPPESSAPTSPETALSLLWTASSTRFRISLSYSFWEECLIFLLPSFQ